MLRRCTVRLQRIKLPLITVKKVEKVAQVIVDASASKIPFTYNIELFNEFTKVLRQLEEDDDYLSVCIFSNKGSLCQGIDFYHLAIGSKEARETYAEELGKAVKAYLLTLIKFSKPIAVAIKENVKNFGVMQLIGFDFIVASSDCTFDISYAEFPQHPEGLCLWRHLIPDVTGYFSLSQRYSLADFFFTFGQLCGHQQPSDVMAKVMEIASKLTGAWKTENVLTKKRYWSKRIIEGSENLDNEFLVIIEEWKSAERYKKFIDQ